MNSTTELIKSLSPGKKAELIQLLEIRKYRWSITGRPSQQLPLGDWQYWLIKAGRGFGKTRTGSEIVRIWKETNPIILLAGRTASDARDVMIEGESGILNTAPNWDRPVFKSASRSLHWNNGAMALIRSAEEPESFRGLQCYKTWCDELASWYYKEGDSVTDAWAQIKMGMRLGKNPQAIITTTPRNTKRMREIIKDPLTIVTGGSTYDNKDNLIKRLNYWIFANGEPELQTTTEYEFDNKHNPYKEFNSLLIPGRYTNTNNIIKETYTIHFEVDQSIDKVQITKNTYRYNSQGFPISKNDSETYVYY